MKFSPLAMLIFLLFASPMLAGDAFAGPVSANDDSFRKEVIQSDLPVIVEFYASYCPACVKVAPVLDQLAAELAGKVKVVKVNTEDAPQTASRYNVRKIPAFFYMDGGYINGRTIGYMSAAELKKELGVE